MTSEAVLRVVLDAVVFPGSHGDTTVVRDVVLEVARGETIALVGESGCGKTVTALATMGLLPAHARARASVRVESRPGVETRSGSGTSRRGGVVAMVFQDATGALNPVRRIGAQIREVVERHRGLRGAEAQAEVRRLLGEVGLPDAHRVDRAFPHQLSGGMRQRVLIALALAGDPWFLLADEPTSALDASVQLQVLDLLRDLTRRRGLGTLLITHDFSVVAHAADRVVVMYAGEVVEEGPKTQVLRAPAHPYTRSLLAALPGGGRAKEALPELPGRMPGPEDRGGGCLFRARCAKAQDRCGERPTLERYGAPGSAQGDDASLDDPRPGEMRGRYGRVRCWFPLESGE